jgi:hypothetical protein
MQHSSQSRRYFFYKLQHNNTVTQIKPPEKKVKHKKKSHLKSGKDEKSKGNSMKQTSYS